ncbi:metabotropic glutamate receptor-like [Diabrotica virgifera virgifera]|uniref:G-protein coupled receptors family 3 profile domain-containing protein n=1 Tax=Diabrotica virgifera virgifera TaxID=50390 RepID=A0ABM5JHF6_DIAVI|nr:metabotropic glutamate receptor-like [Diabrotica virgifera virgifera]
MDSAPTLIDILTIDQARFTLLNASWCNANREISQRLTLITWQDKVGRWFNYLQLDPSYLVFENNNTATPTSACSLPCEVGMIKKQQGDTCCWICDKCEEYEFVYDEFTCKDCGPGYWPYEDKLSCYALELQYMRWNTPYAFVPAAFSCLGILVTFAVIVLFIKHNDTPLVRASGRELSYMLLFGILLCYLNTFALLAKPTTEICITQRFGIGVGFSIIYGALLTKTNRISRIFDSASKSAQRPSYISPKSQVMITCSLIGSLLTIFRCLKLLKIIRKLIRE